MNKQKSKMKAGCVGTHMYTTWEDMEKASLV